MNLPEFQEPDERGRQRVVRRRDDDQLGRASQAVTFRSMAQSRSRLDVRTIVGVVADVLRFVSSMWRPHAQLAAENLFLRKQLALYLERNLKPRRPMTRPELHSSRCRS